MFTVTGPVTTNASAWRGEAAMCMPNRSASYTGFMSAFISISQALQEPVSTSRIVSDRLKSLVLSLASWTTGTIGVFARGYLPVTTPVFRLFLMMRNMFSFLVRREALEVRGFGAEVAPTCCHAP